MRSDLVVFACCERTGRIERTGRTRDRAAVTIVIAGVLLKTTELLDGGLLLYDDAFLPAELADRYFAELRDQCAWEQKPGIFGHMQPRLIASYGDVGVTYRYSGVDNEALAWTATLLEIKEKIEAVQGEYNYCLLNHYRSGSDSMGWHHAAVLAARSPQDQTEGTLASIPPQSDHA